MAASVIIAALIAGPGGRPAARGAVVVGEVSASLEPTPEGNRGEPSSHGYVEYRVHLTNHSGASEKEVTLELPARAYGGRGNALRQIRRTVVLPPGARATVSLERPPLPILGNGLTVKADGQSDELGLNIEDHGSRRWTGAPTRLDILASRSLHQRILDQVNQANVYRTESPVAAWPARWLGYSRYDGVILEAAELEGAGTEVREALLRYVACGGVLAVVGAWEPPVGWAGVPGNEQGIRTYFRGFGAVVHVEALSGATSHVIESHCSETAAPWRNLPDQAKANGVFPVVDNLQIPAKGLLAIMILFAAAIGPVNLWVLARLRRRLWMLWTVPALSLLACLSIWLYSVFAEGWSGRERTELLTILDQETGSASTIGWTACYAPLTPAGGLRYSVHTEVTPLVDAPWGGGGTARTLDWTDGQHLASGWVTARIPAHFVVRRSDTGVRERLRVSRLPGGRLSVLNGLGVDIEALWVRDDDGAVHRAGPVAAGVTVELEPASGAAPAPGPQSPRLLYAGKWLESFARLRSDPEKFLDRGTYIAFVAGSPFLPSGLARVRERRASTIVHGILERGER